MRLLTWNVGRFHLGRLLRLDSRASDSDLDAIAAAVRLAGVDAVGLQELTGAAQVAALVERLGAGWRGVAPEREVADRVAALLLHRRNHAAFATVTTTSGRSATVASFDDTVVMSCHVDAFDAARRRRQIEELVAWALGRGERRVILLGDLNLDLDRPRLQRADDRAAARLLAAHFVDAAPGGEPTWLLGRRLDYALLRRATTPLFAPPGAAPRDATSQGAARQVAASRTRITGRALSALRLPRGDHRPLLAVVADADADADADDATSSA